MQKFAMIGNESARSYAKTKCEAFSDTMKKDFTETQRYITMLKK